MDNIMLQAPRDPKKKKDAIYILLDQQITSVERSNHRLTSEIYLDGERLINKAEIVGCVKDKKILDNLKTCKSFYEMVDSIGVTIEDVKGSEKIIFGWKNYGYPDRGGGSSIEMTCDSIGVEKQLDLSELKRNDQDSIVGQCYFDFCGCPGTAKVTVKLYLNDHYHVPEIKVDPPINWNSKSYEQVLEQGIVQLGNATRMHRVIEKARKGEELTIAFIGGSITQGAGAIPINTNCYARKFFEAFVKRYAMIPKKCHYIKAGIGGTSSELGLIRYEKDVSDYGKIHPDLVIVEFAVNDSGDETNGVCHESLVYRILKENQKPAIIMLFSVFANDFNLQDRLIPIGKKYDIPMVSLKNALLKQFGQDNEHGGVISKRQYFYDIFHPTNDGHRIMADCLIHLVQCMERTEISQKDLDLSVMPALGRQFYKVHFWDRSMEDELPKEIIAYNKGNFTAFDLELQAVERNMELSQEPQFNNNWMHEGKDNHAFILKVKCQSIFVCVKDSDSLQFGTAEFRVDGKVVRTHDPLVVNWPHCNALLLHEGKTIEEHEIQIQLMPNDTDKKYTILGFGIVG